MGVVYFYKLVKCFNILSKQVFQSIFDWAKRSWSRITNCFFFKDNYKLEKGLIEITVNTNGLLA